MRRAARVDGNQGAMIQALALAGVTARSMAALGRGWPDLLTCGRHAETGTAVCVPVEVKRTRRGRLTPREAAWRASWPGPYVVARRPSDVLVSCYGWGPVDAAKVDAQYYAALGEHGGTDGRTH